MSARDSITIRLATIDDWPPILSLVPELVAFGPPPWRDREQMTRTDTEVIHAALASNDEAGESVVYVGTMLDRVVAFVHARVAVDYYTRQPHGHIADLVVADSVRGSGIGTRLIEAAEAWARRRGFQQMTIAVFERNKDALALYERRGFNREILRLIKPLNT